MEIDFILQQGVDEAKAFTYTESLAGSTITLTVYKTVPVVLNGVISGAGNNIVTFVFDNAVNLDLGVFEYKIVSNPPSGLDVELTRGNITYLPSTNFTFQIPTLIQGESLGLIVDPNFQTQQIMYWKLYLQPQFNILDEDVEFDTSWPILARFLIAKLVVHSYIVALIKGALAGSFGSSTSEGETTTELGQLKKMKTGPSEAEWYNGGTVLSDITKVGANGASTFDQLSSDICALALRLSVMLPMCGAWKGEPVVPIKIAPNYCIDISTFLLNENDFPVSNG